MSCDFNNGGQSAARLSCVGGLVSMGTMLLALVAAAPVRAQGPVGATDLAAAEKTGVTLYQANGLHGKIPMKKVYKVDPSGDTGHYELEFASGNMNTKMAFKAKFKLPAGMVFKSLELFTFNGPVQVTTAGADSWDGQTLIDEVTVSPWNMNHVLQQCIQQLTQGDGTFKDSATFDLAADLTEVVRGKGIATFPNAPPGSASSFSGQCTPKTRVTAYLVNAGEKATVDRQPQRLSTPQSDAGQPTRTPTGRPGRPVPPRDSSVGGSRQPGLGTLVLPAGRLTGGQTGTAAKDKFERTKPHVNVLLDATKKAQLVRPK